MKKFILVILVFFIISINSTTQAQTFQVGLNGYVSQVLGDIKETDLNNPSSGYVLYADGGNLEFLYHTKKNFAFGFRSFYTYYSKDFTTYKEDVMQQLGVSDSNMMIQSSYTYKNFGLQLGVAYQFDISEIFSIEPYFFMGGNFFTSPAEQITYYKRGRTFVKKKSVTGFFGFSYSPGLRFQWVIFNKRLGLNASLEYNGTSLETYVEETITYSSNTFKKEYIQRNYNINAINIGIGIFYRFGKGVEK